MISEFGENLSVAILAKGNENWKQFSAWVSVKKYLPEANVTIILQRCSGGIGIEWIKKLKINYVTHNIFDSEDILSNRLEICYWANIKKPLLVMPAESFINREIDFILDKMDTNLKSENVWYIQDLDYRKILEDYRFKGKEPSLKKEPKLACDIKTDEISFISCYNKGVGSWINSMVECPFGKMDLLGNEITRNVMTGIELWREIADYYNQII